MAILARKFQSISLSIYRRYFNTLQTPLQNYAQLASKSRTGVSTTLGGVKKKAPGVTPGAIEAQLSSLSMRFR